MRRLASALFALRYLPDAKPLDRQYELFGRCVFTGSAIGNTEQVDDPYSTTRNLLQKRALDTLHVRQGSDLE